MNVQTAAQQDTFVFDNIVDWTKASADDQKVVSLNKNETLFYEGDAAESIYEVLEGVVCNYRLLLDGRRQILGFAFKGDLVGLSRADKHGFGCEALCPTQVHKISKYNLLETVRQRPEMGHKLLEVAMSELSAVQDHFVILGRKSAFEKVASFLTTLARRYANEGANSVTFLLPMTRVDIADYLGLTIETVSRNFSKLKIRGAIDLPQFTTIVIPDIDCLEEFSESEGDAS